MIVGLMMIPLVVLIVVVDAKRMDADIRHPNQTLTILGFGSCHKSIKSTHPSIWETMRRSRRMTMMMDAWLWMGDAVYPPSKDPITHRRRGGSAPVAEIKALYQEMHTNATIGYSSFHPPMGIYGTWDDHDYGGNDMGKENNHKKERQESFFQDMLQYPPHTIPTDREGVYHSIEWGTSPRKVRAILLDTRYHRSSHCIPSIAHWPIPLANALACATRWLTAGLRLDLIGWLWGCHPTKQTILGDVQWDWLEQQLQQLQQKQQQQLKQDDNDNDNNRINNDDHDDVQLYVIVSSIQILTTNPAMESWGHFPHELERLLKLVQHHYESGGAPIVFLSGDVHHAEFLGNVAHRGLLEVTSSGLTHHCGQPKIYGKLCRPMLNWFQRHRLQPDMYYVGLNYGMLKVNWAEDHDNKYEDHPDDQRPPTKPPMGSTVTIEIHNATGHVVLSTTVSLDPLNIYGTGSSSSSSSSSSSTTLSFTEGLPKTWDGHLLPWFKRAVLALILGAVIARRLLV